MLIFYQEIHYLIQKNEITVYMISDIFENIPVTRNIIAEETMKDTELRNVELLQNGKSLKNTIFRNNELELTLHNGCTNHCKNEYYNIYMNLILELFE